MLKAFLTDLDGVIRIWRTAHDVRAEEAVGLPKGAIKRAAFAADLLLPAITGQQIDEEWRQQIVERLQHDYPTVDANRAVALWSEPSGEVDWAVIDLLRHVHERCCVCLVTNATSRLPHDLARLGVTNEFDQIINSSVVGWAKPQPEFFQAALRAVGAGANEAFFVDDSPKNVDAARALGMAGHIYQDIETLTQVLAKHGIV